MPFFPLATFITTLECNIGHFMVNRVNEPLVRPKTAITLELKICLSNFSREIERQKEIFQGTNIALIFPLPVNLFFNTLFLTDFRQFSKQGLLLLKHY